MKTIVGCAVVLLAAQLHATQIPFRDLTNLVADTDHVLAGTVTQVDMIDGKGNQITGATARTGPGSENQLCLHVSVTTNGVIACKAGRVPEKIVILL